MFFASGFAALIYQVVWQRALFAIFGINTESVTVIVTAFLLGLGLGSLLGGHLSLSMRRPLLLFAIAELGIAVFGIASLELFRRVGAFALGFPALVSGLTICLLLLLPTVLMGMTLPLLVAYLVGWSGNVGRSLSLLYFVNTAGSGLASLVAVSTLLPRLGEHGAVQVAAFTNVVVGAVVLALSPRSRARE
ncbi:MAG: fused MFS/spermidine synthase [Gemmatimonadaceae bacterium]